MRMLSFYDNAENVPETPRSSSDDLRNRIFYEIQRRLPGLLNRKITYYVSQQNGIQNYVDKTPSSRDLIPQKETTTTRTTTTTTTRTTTTAAPKTSTASYVKSQPIITYHSKAGYAYASPR